MLSTIDAATGLLSWSCLLYDREGILLSCGQERTAHVEESRYLSHPQGDGAVIALPRCTCGCQLFLKADYTLKECRQACLPVMNDAGHVWTCVMRPGHARNLVAHWLHYQHGSADVPPVLPLPPHEVIAHAAIPIDALTALWFGYAAYQLYGHQRKRGQLWGTTNRTILI